jgi:hypothetical protein
MSVFTHGVTTKGKPRVINRNQVFPVARRRRCCGRALGLASCFSEARWKTLCKSNWQNILRAYPKEDNGAFPAKPLLSGEHRTRPKTKKLASPVLL